MNSWRGQLAFGLLCYGVFLVVQLPVWWLFERLTPWMGPVRVSGPGGTVWSGSFVNLEWGGIPLGGGQWRLLPERLLQGQMGVAYTLGSSGSGWQVHGQAGVMTGMRAWVEQAEIVLNVDLWRTRLPWIPPGSRGLVRMQVTEAVVDPEGVLALRAQGELVQGWIGAPLEVELGDWRGEAVRDEGRGLLVRLEDRAGPWQGRLTVGIKPDGRYRVRGRLSVRQLSDERHKNLLRVMGAVDAQGGVLVDESGTLQKGLKP
ncbi:MAG: type II secretion system protein N [Magnetococcales bacterium]|nr:type II secretion system protein N [Magnetococcales bacterium]